MDGSFEIDKTARVARIVVSGKFCGDDMLEIAIRLFDNPDYSPDMHTIFDARNLDMYDVSGDGMRGHVTRCIDFLVRNGYTGKTAWVAKHGLGFGMARMYESLRELNLSSPIRVFEDLAAAEEWIVR
jgi:hypothetical protein